MSDQTLNMVSTISDLIIISVIIFFALKGYTKGLAASIFAFFRWFFCIVTAVIFTLPAKGFIESHTGINLHISKKIEETMDSAIASDDFFISLPRQIKISWQDISHTAGKELAKALADTTLITIAFFMLLLILIILSKVFLHSLINKKHGVLGVANRLGGLCFGLLKGLLLASLMMLLAFPVLSYINPEFSSPIVKELRHGVISGYLYDENPISNILRLISTS